MAKKAKVPYFVKPLTKKVARKERRAAVKLRFGPEQKALRTEKRTSREQQRANVAAYKDYAARIAALQGQGSSVPEASGIFATAIGAQRQAQQDYLTNLGAISIGQAKEARRAGQMTRRNIAADKLALAKEKGAFKVDFRRAQRDTERQFYLPYTEMRASKRMQKYERQMGRKEFTLDEAKHLLAKKREKRLRQQANEKEKGEGTSASEIRSFVRSNPKWAKSSPQQITDAVQQEYPDLDRARIRKIVAKMLKGQRRGGGYKPPGTASEPQRPV